MDGPSHYRRAEVLLESCQAPGEPDYDPDGTPVEPYDTAINIDGVDDCRNALMAAQVHATLALAAATAINAPMPNRASTADAAAWRQVAGVEEVHS